MTGAPLLSLRGVDTFYGPIQALREVSLDVPAGRIVIVLGANGAGKSTLLKTVSGMLDPQTGTVTFDGREIQRRDPDRIARLGISHVPEGRETFALLTVRENLLLGAYRERRAAEVQRRMELVFDYFPRLRERRGQPAGLMSGGEQQMLVIGRALMAQPKLILMDEPSLGLSPKLVRDIFEIIRRLKEEQGATILLVEQNAKAALAVADYGYVLELGRVAMSGTVAELVATEAIHKSYLGGKPAPEPVRT
ncbi:MAG: ABC transporter ATP-binding protein [Rhodospirillaceae bacterium]|nr:ABC transporter ATP-binding protein [Rhodospirillaceae bacterium]